jgi:hypothetical protein
MPRYRIEHIADGRFIHAEASSPEDPTLANACKKFGWTLEDCHLILLAEDTWRDKLEPAQR